MLDFWIRLLERFYTAIDANHKIWLDIVRHIRTCQIPVGVLLRLMKRVSGQDQITPLVMFASLSDARSE